MNDHPLKKLSRTLIEEIERALALVSTFGSLELYVQDGVVTQITTRRIKKTKVDLGATSKKDKK